ncbi:hypothetical protein JCM3765_006567 [Sporobolomyces pararoseus]
MSRPPMNLIFPEKSNSGISRNQDGQRVIAATRRPDGSFRQEIKIRPGYTPQEDVSLFRSSKQVELDQHRARKGTVPGLKPNPLVQDALRGISGGGGGAGTSASKSAKKNAKRKEKRNEGGTSQASASVKDSWDDDEEDEGKNAEGTTTTTPSTSSTAPPPAPETLEPTTEDPAKKLRNLKKKLKQTQQLKEKLDEGATLGQAEQDKVDGMKSLEEEIAKLELA